MKNRGKGPMDSDAIEYLTFTLGEDTFTLEASGVREVLRPGHITEVPRMPAHLPGVVNVRGSVISVIDLGQYLHIKTHMERGRKWLVITDTILGGEPMPIGILADTVLDVIRVRPEGIEPTPEIGIHINTEFIKGVAKHDGAFLIIIDLDKVLSAVHGDFCKREGKEVEISYGP